MTLKQLRSVTITEAAEKLNIAPDFIRRLCKSGKVRFFREGPAGTYHVIESDLVARVEEMLDGAEPDPEHELEAPAAEQPQTTAYTRRNIDDLLPPAAERRFSR